MKNLITLEINIIVLSQNTNLLGAKNIALPARGQSSKLPNLKEQILPQCLQSDELYHIVYYLKKLEDISPFCGTTDTLIFDFW